MDSPRRLVIRRRRPRASALKGPGVPVLNAPLRATARKLPSVRAGVAARATRDPAASREKPGARGLPGGEKRLAPQLDPVEIARSRCRRHLPSLVRGCYDAAVTGPGGQSVRWIGDVFSGQGRY